MASAKFADTMIGSKDMKKTAEFYKTFLGMVPDIENEFYILLKDPKTSQTLCIVGDPEVDQATPSLESENLDVTLEELKKLGGQVLKQEGYKSMKLARAQDADGRPLMIWQNL